MNVDALVWAATVDLWPKFRAVHRAVLVAMAVEADERRLVSMSVDDLRAEVGASPQTIISARQALVEHGILEDTGEWRSSNPQKRGGYMTVYRLPVGRGGAA